MGTAADPPPKTVDLHCHSSASSGAIGTPMKATSFFRDAGFAAFSLTEHDTLSSLDAAREAAEREGVEYLPGIEMSVSSLTRSIRGQSFRPSRT